MEVDFKRNRQGLLEVLRVRACSTFMSGGGVLATFGSYQNCHGMRSHDFYYANVCIMYFRVKFGSTSPPWN